MKWRSGGEDERGKRDSGLKEGSAAGLNDLESLTGDTVFFGERKLNFRWGPRPGSEVEGDAW